MKIKRLKDSFIKFYAVKKNRYYLVGICLLILTVVYFSQPTLFFPDSIAYINNAKVLTGELPASSWDSLRGPSLPIIIAMSLWLFGGSAFGLLFVSYVFYIALIIIFWIILNKFVSLLKLSLGVGVLANLLFVGMVVFNPVLFGYSHALLTEYVAFFIVAINLLLVWRWLQIDFETSWFRYAVYSLTLVFIMVFVWFLKQPYLSISLFPLVAAIILSIYKNRKILNIIQRLAVLFICLLVLVLSIKAWDNWLKSNGVTYSSGTSTEQHFLASGIINGLSNTRRILPKYISEDDILLNTDGSAGIGDDFVLVEIRGPYSGDVIDRKLIVFEGPSLTTTKAIRFWIYLALNHPLVLVDSYFSNYLAMSGLFSYQANFEVGVLYPVKKFSFSGHENRAIGLMYSYHQSNAMDLTPDRLELVGFKYESRDLSSRPYRLIHLSGFLYCGLYLVFMLILPFSLLLLFVIYLKLRSKKISKTTTLPLEFVAIALGSAFLHIMFHVFMGAMIDRYAFIIFPSLATSYILIGLVVYRLKSEKKKL